MSSSSNREIITRLKHLRELLSKGYDGIPSPISGKKGKRSKSANSRQNESSENANNARARSKKRKNYKETQEEIEIRMELGKKFKQFLEEKDREEHSRLKVIKNQKEKNG